MEYSEWRGVASRALNWFITYVSGSNECFKTLGVCGVLMILDFQRIHLMEGIEFFCRCINAPRTLNIFILTSVFASIEMCIVGPYLPTGLANIPSIAIYPSPKSVHI